MDDTRPYFEASFTTGTEVNSVSSHNVIRGSPLKASMRVWASKVRVFELGCLNTVLDIVSADSTPGADEKRMRGLRRGTCNLSRTPMD